MLRGFISQLRVSWGLLRDPRVPLWAKAIPFLALAYIFSPLDFIPDIIPGLGQLDDIGIILAGLRLFEAVIPDQIVNEHRGLVIRR